MECSKRQIGRWTFKVFHLAGMERQADWLLSYFEKMRQEGFSFSDRMRIRLGWSVLELRIEDENTFVVYEPDFSSDPHSNVRPDISVTLQVHASQIALVGQLGISPLEVSFQDKIIFAKGCMDAKKIYLERIPPQPDKGDSGWFIGFVEGNNDRENLQFGFVHQLLNLRPMLLQFLMLPSGYMVVLDEDRVEAILDQEGKTVA